MHALGEKHSGLGRVLESAGVKELHDIAGLKQSMQVPVTARGVFGWTGEVYSFGFRCVSRNTLYVLLVQDGWVRGLSLPIKKPGNKFV